MNEGRITISNPSSSSGESFVQIEMEDKVSGSHFLRVKMSYENFARAVVSNTGLMPCEFELYPQYVGKARQTKREKVYVADGGILSNQERTALATVAVGLLERDGWKGRVQDAMNHHRVVDRDDEGTWYSVHFSRYVEIEEVADE